MATKQTINIVLDLDTRVPEFIVQATGFVTSVGNNVPIFGTPAPPLASIQAAITALQQAQIVANTRARGAAAARGERHIELINLVKALAAYVLLTATSNPANAKSIIAAGGFGERQPGDHSKPPIAAKQGPVLGSARVRAKAGPKGTKVYYEWRFSVDGGKTWSAAPGTNDANTVIYNLPTATVVCFQVRLTVKNVVGDWGPIVSLVVH